MLLIYRIWILTLISYCQGLGRDGLGLPDWHALPHLNDESMERVHLERVDDNNNNHVGVNLGGASIKYRLYRNRRHFNLTLFQNTELTTPGCLVYGQSPDGMPDVRPCPTDGCHYMGHVDDDHTSWLAMSDCGEKKGLRGLIKLQDEAAFIEPSHVRVAGVTHVMYRFDALSTDKQSCSLFGPRVFEPPATATTRSQSSKRSWDLNTDKLQLETSIAVHPSMTSYHGNAIQDYIMMLFNMASQLYRDASLGKGLQITLHSVVVNMTDYEELHEDRTDNMTETLTNFCSWQSSYPHYKPHPPDCTVMVKRFSGKSIGVSNQGGACIQDYRCGVVRDQGPHVTFALAHEIGHLVGMGHDQDGGCLPMIMGANGASGPDAFRWSSCSRDNLSDFIGKKTSHCLTMKSQETQPGLKEFKHLPGYLYTADDQCREVNGDHMQFAKDYTIDPCYNLNCTDERTRRTFINTQPLMDGTDINNTRTMCYKGRAVAMDSALCTDLICPNPINGRYTEWSDSTTCSRSCGGGIRQVTRSCTNPAPRYGGYLCDGPFVKTVLCNLQPCDIKPTPCQDAIGTNSSVMDRRPCELYCSDGEYQKQLYLQNWEECQPLDILHRCDTSRQCRTFGCDGRLDSGLEFDNCGMCNGDNSSCTEVNSTDHMILDNCTQTNESQLCNKCRFGTSTSQSRPPKCSKHHVIPSGSTNIIIKNPTFAIFSPCYLSLVINGYRFCNFSQSGYYESSETIIKYNKRPERFEITGPTPFDIEIEMNQCNRRYNCSVDYKYHVPKRISFYTWVTSYQTCSKSCGTGVSVPEIKCVNIAEYVADTYCDIRQKPAEHARICNDFPCISWNVSSWSECTQTCGTGQKSRVVSCIEEGNNGTVKEVDISLCQQKDRPESDGHCYVSPCSADWITGKWSKCSRTCGDSLRHRPVVCQDDTGLSIESKWCNDTNIPEGLENCPTFPCLKDCGPVPNVPNGQPQPPTRTISGETVTYSCDTGYHLDGAVSIQCSDGHWSEAPLCIKDLCEDVLLNCTRYDLSVCSILRYRPFCINNCQKSANLCDGPSTEH